MTFPQCTSLQIYICCLDLRTSGGCH